ncbi:DUF1178 family protein [Sphingomonas lacunae]|uniref:DUF1178 family protein n=1 Tax=Sphingomonas lacunae TaxID=2698828 RepID=A0A6M4AWL6_9SPHN|nr:DUF1178 family protein [Sphingomonas lacunae]QJQ32439.1 DUF1178 family protein [Sphingomonas lacunae]
MISFDLKCQCGHVFEVWFRSSTDYEDQQRRRLIACPLCSGSQIGKAVMAPNVAAKGNSRSGYSAPVAPAELSDGGSGAVPAMISAPPVLPALPPEAVAMLNAIAKSQAEMLPQSRWVGNRFADEARALHRAAEEGEIDAPSPIHGQATPQEAEALAEEGIAVMPLLVPVVPPEQRN